VKKKRTIGLRIGLYDPLKRAIAETTGAASDGFALKVASGLATGALAICVASPTDLVKVRMQAEGKLPPGVPRRYPSALGAYSVIVRMEGVKALWTGLGPNVARNAIINAAELASYDAIKEQILKVPGVEDGVPVHLAAGLGAGFFAVVCGSPGEIRESSSFSL
jgi:solute carrier family 25 uncoupling protein 8/9